MSGEAGRSRSGRYAVRLWDFGSPEVLTTVGTPDICIDVVTPSGDVVQVVVRADGQSLVRAWRRDDLYENGGSNHEAFSVSGSFASENARPTS